MKATTATLARPDEAAVASALAAAVDHSWRTQRDDGSWETFNDCGPISTAGVIVALHYAGQLDPADAREAARWLVGEQRPDGSWIGSPFLTTGDLGVTATAWAALHAAGLPPDHPAVVAARTYVERGGGTEELLRRIGRGDLAALYLVMAGLLDPSRLPVYPLQYCLIDPLRTFLERRVHCGLLTFFLETAILVRRLRGDWGPDGGTKSDLDAQACRRCLALLDEFQQDDGSWWNGLTHWSALIVATLHAMALPESGDRIARGLPAIHRFKVHDEAGLRWMLFGNNVWATSFHTRALLAAGESPPTRGSGGRSGGSSAARSTSPSRC